MSKKCAYCSSYAINHHLHGRDGSSPDLCDVCYWRDLAEHRQSAIDRSDMIIAECVECGEPMVCLPDRRPRCKDCAFTAEKVETEGEGI